MVIIPPPFLGKTNHRGGKEDTDDDADNVGEKRYDKVRPLGMVFDYHCEVDTRRYPTSSPYYGEEYPRPQQHDKDASKQA